MRILNLGRYALGVCAAAMLAGCGGGSGTPISSSTLRLTEERTHVRPAYSVIYPFKGGADDGADPLASLINVKGTLYGTTYAGGSGSCNAGGLSGCGTVFKVTTAGTETVLHSFAGGKRDGKYPYASLINVNGTLYGTTYAGGSHGNGTVFTIRSGRETVLYSFKGYPTDGANPVAGLINVNGTLYGTTFAGGSGSCSASRLSGCGTVFKITTSGTETVLYSFATEPDGYYPAAALLNVKGTLYGTTEYGGARGVGCYTCGTVFTITTSGTETVLYRFKGGRDGRYPVAGLINVNGILYGTTHIGDVRHAGTVFKVTTSGTETVLHEFVHGSGDGEDPRAGLININGTLYGTTTRGGNCNPSFGGCGTVFEITRSGAETVLYSFAGSPDGAFPFAGLLSVNGTLYGTTSEGGTNDYGTAFALTP